MKRIFLFAIAMLCLLPLVRSTAVAGEVIDGVIATVNHKPIFQSDWEEAICFEAFMQQKPLSQVTQADKVSALQRLIDRQLLRGQMADQNYMQPSADDLRDNLAKLRAQIPGAQDEKSWQGILSSYWLSESAVKEHLKTELQVMNFVEVRLRPNVHVQADEIESYYKEKLLTELQRAGGKIVALNEIEPKIRELLTQQHMDELLDAWLHNLRQQSDIQTSVPMPAETASAGKPTASGVN
jgi:hypothetical protein